MSTENQEGAWVCPWGICNTKQAQECRAEMRQTWRASGCGSRFPPGTTLEQAQKMIDRSGKDLL